MEKKENSSSFSTGNSAQERALPYAPDCYVIPPSCRPDSAPETARVPVIDFAKLNGGEEQRAIVVDEIGSACAQIGFFQIVNHGICQSILDGALSSAFDFFKLPSEAKMKFMSNDVHKPVRYSTSIKDEVDKIQFWRVLLKHYAHPLDHWIGSWPQNPPNYREKMSKYCTEVRKLAMELMAAITESLRLGPKYLGSKMDEGMQVMAVNCYPPCPQPEITLGLPPHSDYTCLSVVLQSSPGLEILDSEDGSWRAVPAMDGALQVHVGDHLEVLSNGKYRSVVHRVALKRDATRVSIASLHSLGMDEKMETAEELVDDEKNPKGYRESSFGDFLNFLSKNDFADGKSFISTLKIKN